KLSDADRKRQKELQAKVNELQKELQPYFQEISKLYDKGDRKTPEGRAELEKKAMALAQKYKKALDEQSKLYGEMRRFQRPMHYHGYVWLYLRRPPDAAAAR